MRSFITKIVWLPAVNIEESIFCISLQNNIFSICSISSSTPLFIMNRTRISSAYTVRRRTVFHNNSVNFRSTPSGQASWTTFLPGIEKNLGFIDAYCQWIVLCDRFCILECSVPDTDRVLDRFGVSGRVDEQCFSLITNSDWIRQHNVGSVNTVMHEIRINRRLSDRIVQIQALRPQDTSNERKKDNSAIHPLHGATLADATSASNTASNPGGGVGVEEDPEASPLVSRLSASMFPRLHSSPVIPSKQTSFN